MGLKKCKECGNQVSTKADKCPNCGIKNPGKKTINKFWIGLINISIIIFFIYAIFGGDSTGSDYNISSDADKFSTLSLNVREGPSTNYDVVTALNPGEFVKVIKDSSGWNLIETIDRQDNKTGWASENYLTEVNEYSAWRDDREQQEAAPREPTRQEIIEESFSKWDGSHLELVKEVKDRMHDPSSFDHVETRYSDQGDHLYVVMEFRGTNAFGGVVRQTASAHCDLNGNVIEILGIN